MEKTAASVPPNLEAFIKRWSDREGGSERANYALFLVELCDLIGVQRPDPAGQETERNEYVFERAVRWLPDISDEEALFRLVVLNKKCAEEESNGIIRWLRPEYQISRAKVRISKDEQIEAKLEAPEAVAPILPKDDADLVAMLRQTMRSIGKPAQAKDIAQHFRDGSRASRRVERGLKILAAAGVVRRTSAGWFLPADRSASHPAS